MHPKDSPTEKYIEPRNIYNQSGTIPLLGQVNYKIVHAHPPFVGESSFSLSVTNV